MKKTDEMDRSIQLRAEELGYRAIVLMLCVWTLFRCWQTLVNGAEYRPLPGLILCAGVSIQGFAQMAMKQKMVAGDEEYREPNRLARSIIATVVLTAVILFVGTYFLMKA